MITLQHIELVSCLAAHFPLLWVRELITEHGWVVSQKKVFRPLHEKVRSLCGGRKSVKVLKVVVRVWLEQSGRDLGGRFIIIVPVFTQRSWTNTDNRASSVTVIILKARACARLTQKKVEFEIPDFPSNFPVMHFRKFHFFCRDFCYSLRHNSRIFM